MMAMESGNYAIGQDKAGGGLMTYAQTASKDYLDPPTAPTVSAITDAHQTFEEARILAHRVKDIVGRLIGYVPEDPNKCGSVSDALFDNLKSNSVDTRQAIGEAMDALRRLESQLP